ncbi:hypothetical protein HPB52_023525 [Rhipicephalus sanguineus]|uniref:HTH psq-type domain-containing protein n=1 Tax=Rhipicephalus sanguineus TaxID=34632 RepID=A0A9D4TC73_RHISA|nr:hypothetical protein HPB52_023525 [Rhipicephalus sanguineus]
MATQKRAHHALTLEKKMDIILDFESGSYSKTALAAKHGVPKSSLTRILHDKDKLRDAFETSRFGPQRKRLRHGDHEELEKYPVSKEQQQKFMDRRTAHSGSPPPVSAGGAPVGSNALGMLPTSPVTSPSVAALGSTTST